MKLPLITLGAVLCAALAACGGGSSGGGPVPVPVASATATPTPKPTTAPQAVHYAWQGSLAPGGGTQTFSIARIDASGTATPIPVQATLCDPKTADCRAAGSQQYFGGDTNPTVDISDSATPAPTAAPTLSPPPGLSVALQHSQSPTFSYRFNTPTTAGCGDINVAFSNASGKVRECSYSVVTIGCATALANQPGGGYDTTVYSGFAFDTNSYVTDPTKADVYMTGQTCPGAFYAANGGPLEYKVYFPYGATALSTIGNSLATISPASWTNTFTSVTFNGGENQNGNSGCGAALNCIVLFKTAAGNIGELQVTRENDGGPGSDLISGNGDWFTAGYALSSAGSFPQ